MVNIYKSFCEIKALKRYRWFKNGLGGFYAVHGAVALAAHLRNASMASDLDTQKYHTEFDQFVDLFQSDPCDSALRTQALPVLLDLQ